MDLGDYRRENEKVWRRMAAGWYDRREQIWDFSHAVGEWLVDRTDPQAGEVVLELACGAGDTGFIAAERGARLIATDLAPEMVEGARRHGEELGIERAEFRTMDAERMDLPDDSVDVVVCRWGYMLMADPAAALAETRRVLRDGGRLAFSVWAEPAANPWAAVPASEVIEQGHRAPPEPGAPGIFGLADESRLRALVSDAGFESCTVEHVTMSWRFADFDEYWWFVTEIAGALAMLIAELPDDRRDAVREGIKDRVRPFRDGREYELPGCCLNVLAR